MNPRWSWLYPLLMGLAILTGIVLSRGRQTRLGLTASQRLGLAIGAFCGAMLGAKLPFLLADWPGLLSGMAWFSNGMILRQLRTERRRREWDPPPPHL